MNKKGYTPIRLLETLQNIKNEHGNIKVAVDKLNDEHMERLIRKICSLSEEDREAYIPFITESEYLDLAAYFTKNTFELNTVNIAYVLKMSLSDSIFEAVYKNWAENYDRTKRNGGLVRIFMNDCISDKRCAETVKQYHLKEVSDKWFHVDTEELELEVCRALLSMVVTFKGDLKQTADYYGIYGSNLYLRSLDKQFLCCGANEYLSTTDAELYDLIKVFNIKNQKIFVKNFLKVMDVKILYKRYRQYIWKLIYNMCGDPDKAKNTTFFATSENNLEIKYRTWYNLIQAEQVFGDDERGIFWKKVIFDYEKEGILYKYHNTYKCIVMNIGKYAFIEFKRIDNNVGPVYAFTGDYFKKHVERYFKEYVKNIKYELLHYHTYKEGFDNRIEHRGNWQGNISRLINRLMNSSHM